MAGFSKSVWQGQGIPMQTEPNRVPEIMANFGNNLSRGVERWIKASEERKEQAKRDKEFMEGMRKVNKTMKFVPEEEAASWGAGDWKSALPFLPAMYERNQQREITGGINAFLGLDQTKTVPEFGYEDRERPEVRAEMNEMIRRMSAQGAKPADSMPTDQSLLNVSRRGDGPLGGDKLWADYMEATTGVRPLDRSNPYLQRMGKFAEQSVVAHRKISENDAALRKQLAEADSRLMEAVKVQAGEKEVPKTRDEIMADISGVIKQFPASAGTILSMIQKDPEKVVKMTEGERKAYMLGQGMKEASRDIAKYEQSASPAGFGGWVQGKAPNWTKTEDYQAYRSAAERWSEFQLRAITGAAATPAEVDRAFKNFFPQPGDSPKTIESKREARKSFERVIMTGLEDQPGMQPAAQPAQQRTTIDYDAKGNPIIK